jgi:XRE family aerobic/anaerobic benzoate catabolism transcriptional regulator
MAFGCARAAGYSAVVPDHPLFRHLGAIVRSLRTARGWSRRDLADRSDISERFLADVELGRANPSLMRLLELANALQVSLVTLLGGEPVGSVTERRQHVALLGLRGAGKSTVGPLLAEALGMRFIELDQRVEGETGLQLSELFALHGEGYYREAERAALRRVFVEPRASVIAVGGGLVAEPESYALVRKQCLTVWLRAEPRDHWQRVVNQGDVRPMADNDRAFADLRQILHAREPLYRLADVTVETSGRQVTDIVEVLSAELAERVG